MENNVLSNLIGVTCEVTGDRRDSLFDYLFYIRTTYKQHKKVMRNNKWEIMKKTLRDDQGKILRDRNGKIKKETKYKITYKKYDTETKIVAKGQDPEFKEPDGIKYQAISDPYNLDFCYLISTEDICLPMYMKQPNKRSKRVIEAFSKHCKQKGLPLN